MPLFLKHPLNRLLKRYSLPILGMLLGISACATHEEQQVPLLFKQNNLYEFNLTTSTGQMEDYWELLNSDQQFNKFIQSIFANNYSLKQSIARIKQNQAKYRITSAGLKPYLSSSFSATKSQSVSETTGTPIKSESERFSLSVSASYDLDFFGENQAVLSAAILEILAQVEEHRHLIINLFNDFTIALINMQEAKLQLKSLEKTLTNDEANLEFITERYNLGLATLTEVYQAQQEVISTKSKFPDYQSNVRTQEFAIKQLTGLIKNDDLQLLDKIMTFELPDITVGLPSELVSRRPDIVAALLRIKSSNHQVAAAVAEQYPRFSLTASGGTQSQELSNLLNPDYSVWSLAGNITMPIFDAGGKKAAVKRQEYMLEERIETYQSRLFQAFQKINEFISRINLQNEKIKLIEKQVNISRLILSETTNDYLQGLSDWSSILSAQTKADAAETQLISTRKDLQVLKVQLYTELGNNWSDEILQNQISFLLEEIKDQAKGSIDPEESTTDD